MRGVQAWLLVLLVLVTIPVMSDDGDDAALLLGGDDFATPAKTDDWRVTTEAAFSESTLRESGSRRDERLSLDLNYEKTFADNWRAVFANRLDAHWQDNPSDQTNVNTLKEAYLSWQVSSDRIADLGRINTRFGVAYGYNPTDYFRAGAVRSRVSIDPSSLRENRLGSAMLRGQSLWADGSFTALYSPKVANEPSDSEFSADFGATNRRDRWLLAVSHKLNDKLSPQWLLYGGAGESPQLGLNLTTLLNDASVAHFEWSGGRSESLLSQALMRQEDESFHSRLATGLTYTTSNRLSLTLEYHYNGAGLDRNEWDALRDGSPAEYGQYRGFVADLQDPPTRQRVFLRANWQDAFLNHLDLTGNVFHDLEDSSRLAWLEARYHWTRVDVALLHQINSGETRSNYGALSEQRIWQVLARVFF